MENEKPKGVFWDIRIFAYLEIAMGLLGIWLCMLSIQVLPLPSEWCPNKWVADSQRLFFQITIPYFFLLGVLTLKLKPIGRALNIFLSPVTSLVMWVNLCYFCTFFLHSSAMEYVSLRHTILIIICGSGLIIFYLILTKVKEQFKP